MKKVNNLVVLASIITASFVAYKVSNKTLGKLVQKKKKIENKDNVVVFDDYKEIDLLDYENPRVERQYVRVR